MSDPPSIIFGATLSRKGLRRAIAPSTLGLALDDLASRDYRDAVCEELEARHHGIPRQRDIALYCA